MLQVGHECLKRMQPWYNCDMNNQVVAAAHFGSVCRRFYGEGHGDQTAFIRQVRETGRLRYARETIRQQLVGLANPTREVMEAAAKVMGVSPETFFEYRIWLIEQAMREQPDLVDEIYGLFRAHLGAEKEKRRETEK